MSDETTNNRMMKVSVLQMECDDTGNKQKNMETFQRLVEQAVAADKNQEDNDENKNDRSTTTTTTTTVDDHLILGPECAICGYSYDFETAWKSAEPQGGPTERFLCELSKKHNLYLGVTYLEAYQEEEDEEAHVYNTFCLAGPDGTIKGRVSKNTPCSVEAYLFTAPKEQRPKYIIDCDGKYKFAVLICYENFVYESVKAVASKSDDIDLLLQPFSGPLADDTKQYVKEQLRELYLSAGPTTAKYMSCPTLYCNKIGKWKQPSPSTLLPMKFDTEFPGCSTICNSSGEILGRLDDLSESTLTRIIQLGTNTSTPTSAKEEIPCYWGGFTDGTPFLKICHIYQFFGSKSYQNDERRKKIAKDAFSSLSSLHPSPTKTNTNYTTDPPMTTTI